MFNWTKNQAAAIYESGKNIIVSAGAGSGKTAVLTERVIQKILHGTHINELLILTFTKAAAGEMKDRIREALKDNGLLDELKLIDSAYITTFDSYALAIVKKYHYLLNITSDINIVDGTLITIRKKELMDQLFDEYYANEDEQFLKLVDAFCTRDDQNLKDAVLNIAMHLEMIPDLNHYLENYVQKYFSDEFIDQMMTEFTHLVISKIDDLKVKIAELKPLVDGKYYLKLEEALGSFLTCKSIEEVRRYPNLTLPNLPRGSEEEVKSLKEKATAIIKEINALMIYGTTEEIKENILKTKDGVITIIDILKKYFFALHTYKDENEMYEFIDIALLAIRILKENPDACLEVKNSLKEILIDEYQDTNDIQETFINLIANNNVYMVGDIKQSIYRFRNANPYIFKNKYDNYAQSLGGMKIDLVENFRSREEVLGNINELFNLVMDDMLGGAAYQDSHQMVFGNKAYIKEGKTKQDYNLDVLEYDLPKDSPYRNEEVEIFAIAKDIKDKIDHQYQIFDKNKKILRPIQYRDFVIIMDRSNQFNLYKKVFEYLGIPLTVCRKENLNGSNDLFIIKNIITLIIKINEHCYDTLFKYCFTSVARSFLFNYSDEEIFDYFLNKNFKDASIYKMFQDIDIDSMTPSHLIELIIERTSFYDKIIYVGDIDNSLIRLQKLIEMASNLGSYGYDIIRFNEYLASLIKDDYEIFYELDDSGSDSVKIMNIHHSKGLEYPICYFSGLYKTFNISELKDHFFFNAKYGFIIPYFEEGINSTIYKELLKDNYLKEEVSEKIRLFYVALTRAKEKMIMVLPHHEEKMVMKDEEGHINLSIRRKYRSFADIMYTVKDDLASYFHPLDLDSLNLTKEYLFNKDKKVNHQVVKKKIEVNELDLTYQEVEHTSFSHKTNDLITKETYQNMKYGTGMHALLEHLDFKHYEPLSDKYLDAKVRAFLDSDIMHDIDQAKIYKEWEFIYTKDNVEYQGIIDLMLEYSDHITIIDYKLNDITNEDYLKQLKGYRDYVMTKSNKPIKLYLYSIMSGEIKEII